MKKIYATVLVAAALIATPAMPSEITLGRWCDRMLPNLPRYNRTIEIVISEAHTPIARNSFADGSTNEQILEELGGDLYAVSESPSGDRYRVVASSGDLQLLDGDGIIRTAGRLENTLRDGECR
ncbi:hypothetical protein ACCS91_23740 [Rhizobium ruizarguesonis]|uniref:hypothetical protein n=1 Tax=Rhizobium ruizarguesonis TaxID=2081791 RepID=UPI001030D073|nr:hypothetical protein [Rhizobium ruizarguesonis]TAW77445.1 hypothetical protein ELI10_09730 [Rhizobium ruizarguesonis]TAX14411.1 hypothetical protein ELI09_09790 [Rhizobium ruizarguesonis]TAX19242.1 hypothetical protein ELI08_09790 [Rhizobium ruizarguesonis]